MAAENVITFPIALGAGAISFITPCVLPLVPVYLSILSGTSFQELTGKGVELSPEKKAEIQKRVIVNAILFILGFSTIFIASGALAGTVGDKLRNLQGATGAMITNILLIVFGPLLLIMGLNQSGVYKPAFLNSEKRFQVQKGKLGLLSSYLIGAAFSFGWAPCIGPILTAILAIAAESGSRTQGSLLLATYSLGLAIPFFLSALSVNGLLAFSTKMRKHFDTLELFIGIVLVLFGLFLTLLSIDGFRLNANSLDLVRQRIPALNEVADRWEGKILGDEQKEIKINDSDEVPMIEVTGESVVVEEDTILPPPDSPDGSAILSPEGSKSGI